MCDSTAKAALNASVLECDDKFVVFFQRKNEFFINAGDKARVDECGLNTFLGQFIRYLSAFNKEVTGSDERDIFAAADDLKFVQIAVVGIYRSVCEFKAISRYSNRNFMLIFA